MTRAGWLASTRPSNFKTDIDFVVGKTVLASRVIEELEYSKDAIFAYFYCKYGDQQRNSLGAILKALLTQFISRDGSTTSYIYEECSKSNEAKIESLELLKRMVETTLEGVKKIWMIIDGLDECEKKERKKILAWVTTILKMEADGNSTRLRIFLVSQDEGDIRRNLPKSASSISLNDMPQHQEEIRSYTSRKLAKLKIKFDLPTAVEKDAVDAVTERAQGKYQLHVANFILCLTTIRNVSFCTTGAQAS
jgi:Cdc6-like AAA superfamily ATPase